MKFLLFTFVGVVHLFSLNSGKAIYKNDNSQRTFQEIKEEVARYGDVAKAIINLAVYGKAQNRSYERLALLVDTVGPRPSGSKSLEKAIQIMYQNLQEDGLENVHLEPVKIPHWERGEESAVMLEPRIHKMAILGLGSSIGTPPEGITAEVLVVTSFKELQRRAREARGKIVVYNQPYVNYSKTVQYRVRGAVEAAKVGALASLIRSVASFSVYSPHTGIQEYQDGVPKIPTACITVEDAEMMSRMASRGNRIVIQLKMGAKNYPDADSFNTVAEIIGSKYPEQVSLLLAGPETALWPCKSPSRHKSQPSAQVGNAVYKWSGAGLRPKRTLRLVLWTAEEQGGIGGFQYYQSHKANISNYSLVMESDEGTFLPSGLQFTGSEKARAIVEEVMTLLQPVNITQVFRAGEGTDINFWIQAGVPGASLLDDLYKYFSFHHSHGDTMTVMDPKQMNVAAAVWAVVSYVIADMEEMLPRS
ncbi:carboxypeptidase Q isoform X2 [Ursus arctos]|uniref:carboxypeptidase Q isoform X2 n=1 Tax=Ursus arctos TaxID=9644 RepID=UPI0025488008|nr:carboxypeptidase Q isoform X2 [Ursus arctos]XP_057164068.1 carboxypeptidase Q isoform X2 [Ursus arctos]XP_057164069.1 carboxypeptidase Q isoform X2 [Ursus arctos]